MNCDACGIILHFDFDHLVAVVWQSRKIKFSSYRKVNSRPSLPLSTELDGLLNRFIRISLVHLHAVVSPLFQSSDVTAPESMQLTRTF